MRLPHVPLAIALATGCGSAPAPSGADTGAVADTGPDPACLQPDRPTWSAWGEGFFITWCQACHSRTTPQRSGAPPGIDFDHAGDVRRQTAAIRRTVLDTQRMPLGGGLDEADRAALALLLRCGP